MFDGPDEERPLIGTYCGQDVPKKIRSSSNALHVTFYSDNRVHGTGFVVGFMQIDGIYIKKNI